MSHLPLARNHPRGIEKLILLGVGAIVLLSVGSHMASLLAGIFPDTDDMLRLQQVRDLMAGQAWYDVNQSRLLTPEGGAMHWSRLPDIALISLISILTPIFGPEVAEYLAAGLWPLSLFLVLLIVVVRVLRDLGISIVGQAVALIFLATSSVVYNFWPGRIDHHNLVSLSIFIGFAGLIDPQRRNGSALVSGLALCTALSVAVESLPYVGALIGCYGLAWIVRGHQESRRLTVLGAALMVFSTIFLLVDAPGWGPARQVCDAYSYAHWGGLVVAGGGISLLGLFAGNIYDWRQRFGLGVGLAILCLITVALINPACLNDPYANVPELVRVAWLSVVGEAQTLPDVWDSDPSRAIHQFGFTAASFVAMVLMAASAKAPYRFERFALLILMSIATLATIWQIRGVTFSHIFGIIAAAWLVEQLFLRWRRGGGVPAVLVFCVGAFLLAPMSWKAISDQYRASLPAAETQPSTNVPCRAPSLFKALPQQPVLKIFTPIDLGIPVIVFTPHASYAGPYHRNVEGLEDVLDVWRGSPSTARAKLEALHADHVLICPGMTEINRYIDTVPNSFAAALSAGDAPEWLEPVLIQTNEEAVFTLYRIKPE